jgi:tetratricopeptide (TPR) repeat protein
MRLPVLAALVPIFAPVFATAALDKPVTFDGLIERGRAAFLASDLDRAESVYIQACPAGLMDTYPVEKVITCENSPGSIDEARGNPARAEQRFLHAVAEAEQAGPAYLPRYCASLIELGNHYRRVGRAAEGEASLLKAVGIARTVTAAQTALLPEALVSLGQYYSDSGRPELARPPLTEALALIAAAEGDNRPKPPALEIALAHDLLGMLDLSSGRQHEAESRLRESVAVASRAFGDDHPVTAAIRTNLAIVLMGKGEFDGANLLLRRALFIVESLENPPQSELAAIYAGMSDCASATGKIALAEDYARRALSIVRSQPRPDARSVAVGQLTLAGVYLRARDAGSAEKILPAAVKTLRGAATSPATLAVAVQLLAELRVQQRNWHGAEALYREAIGIYERSRPGNETPAAAPLLRALASVLRHEGGSKAEIRELESRAHDIAGPGTSR